jgi:hypothetical protein
MSEYGNKAEVIKPLTSVRYDEVKGNIINGNGQR